MYVTGPALVMDALDMWRDSWGDDIVLEAGTLNKHQPRDASRNAVTILWPDYVYPFEWYNRLDVCEVKLEAFDERACKAHYPDAYSITYCTPMH